MVAKSDLHDDCGLSYAIFRAYLRPRRVRIALDLALGLAALVGTGVLAIAGLNRIPDAWPIFVGLAAVSFGYWMAYLQLFIHEAAHFNLVKSRIWNDRIGNLLIGLWVGVRIENYRAIHWGHHRLHGQPGDTEHSYFSSLNATFFAETLLGIKALKVIVLRRGLLRAQAEQPGAPGAGESGLPILVLTVAVHLSVIAALVLSGHWQVAIAWIAGLGMFFPCFGALRQLLEHRSELAQAAADYSVTVHGRTTRMFREGVFASTFGGAGFTRHLLHHWDPSVSYTNLAEVEQFLARCDVTRNMNRHKTTYWRAFLDLYGR